MSKIENKTRETSVSVDEFLASVPDAQRRTDGERLIRMHTEETGQTPRMWGPSIVGFGKYHYRYASGREGDAPAAGFSPRKKELTVYLMAGVAENYKEELKLLGPHKTGVSCLYLKRLSDIDEQILRRMIRDSYQRVMTMTHVPT